MAAPYGIGGTTTTGLTAPQVDSFVSGSISSTALAELNKALAVADSNDATKPIFDLNFDTTGGAQTISGASSSTSDVPVFFAGASTSTSLTLSGTGSQIVIGGSSALTAVGSDAAQTLIGGSGTTQFSAGTAGGDHVLEGGSGGSTLIGGTGNDTLIGGLYSSSADTLYAGTGLSQRLNALQGNNVLHADTTTAGVSDTLIGGISGNDTLIGSGLIKDHTYYSVGYGSASTTITGGAGKDSVFVFKGSGVSSIDGGAGKNDVTFVDQKKSDAVVHTNQHTGVTTVQFGGSTQKVELTGFKSITFENGHTIKI